MNETVIRKAKPSDAESLLEIYSHYVRRTAITFEYDVPSIGEFEGRIEKILKKYPYILAENEGRVVGYAYASSFIAREAYSWSAEVTVYIDKDCRECGIGKMLYNELEALLKNMGITNLYACVAVPGKVDEYLTDNSISFHKHMGYAVVGQFNNCGYKFDRWYDMVWMEKIIGEHNLPQADVKWFCEL